MGNRFDNPHNRNLGYSAHQFEKQLEKERAKQCLSKDPEERKAYEKEMRKLEEERAKQEQKLAPTEKQIKCYNTLRRKCSKRHIAVKIKKPNTKLEFSEAIDYLDKLLNEGSEQASFAAVKLYEKDKLLALFDKMTAAQKTRLLAYAEGMLGKSADTANGRKSS